MAPIEEFTAGVKTKSSDQYSNQSDQLERTAPEILFTYPTLTLTQLWPDTNWIFWCCFDSANQEIMEITTIDKDQ